jgi:ferric-dicitrate binding protein FerR (iron transport regulator)
LKRFEQIEEDETWTPANVTEHWNGLRREIQGERRRWPPGEVWTMAVAGVSIAALWIVLIWSHQSTSRLPRRPDLAQLQPAARALGPEQSRPEQSAAESRMEPWTTWPRTDLGLNGTLWSKPGSAIRLPGLPAERSSDPRGGYIIQLDQGSLCAEVAPRELASEGPFSVKTPQLDATVVGTHFCVEAGPELSSVSVQRGRVRVSHEEAAVVLEAGESIRSDSPRLRAARALQRPSERPMNRVGHDRRAPGNPVDAPEGVGGVSGEPLGRE